MIVDEFMVRGWGAGHTVGMQHLEVVQGDITLQALDAVVNAANTSLLGGGGVDGAIHRAAGPELLAATRKLGGCATGEAKLTPGFKLPARYVIHTVGPIWRGGNHNEASLLKSCYRRALELASQHDIHTLAFPSISTGVYGYPIEQASRIALKEISHYQKTHDEIKLVRVVCFSQTDLRTYQRTRKTLNV